MKIIKFNLIVFFFILRFIAANAQYDYPGDEPVNQNKEQKVRKSAFENGESRVFFGGNLGLSFGAYTYIELAPTIGYKFTPRFRAGIGPEYLFFKWREINYKSSIYGFRNFASFSILKDINEVINLNISDIFLYGENEVLNISVDTDSSSAVAFERGWYDLLLGGFGVRMPIGSSAGVSLLILWGLNPNAQILYSNPEIRFSVDF